MRPPLTYKNPRDSVKRTRDLSHKEFSNTMHTTHTLHTPLDLTFNQTQTVSKFGPHKGYAASPDDRAHHPPRRTSHG